ncbi:hypothetical protein DFH06DRAFT_147764 [Mycena polygramma]|nr:hypothetical protein DFH06DRAFT_147764 [Mycena polygramma]
MFPLLLQFPLLLFSAALSTYLWTTNRALSMTVLVFTAMGFGSYTALLLSAATSPDSPYRIPLVSRIIPMQLIGRGWTLLRAGFSSIHFPPSTIRHFLRKFRSLPQRPDPICTKALLEPSPEVAAVSWMLENSTDPNLVRLRDAFASCFMYDTLDEGQILLWDMRHGMSERALHLGAYFTLSCVSQAPGVAVHF